MEDKNLWISDNGHFITIQAPEVWMVYIDLMQITPPPT